MSVVASEGKPDVVTEQFVVNVVIAAYYYYAILAEAARLRRASTAMAHH